MPLPWLILSEGESDEAFFKNLFRVRNISNMEVRRRPPKLKGDTVFMRWLEGLKPETGYEKHSGILIVADNDSNPTRAFRKIQRQIEQAGQYGVPEAAGQVATAQNELPAIAVLMLPWAVSRDA